MRILYGSLLLACSSLAWGQTTPETQPFTIAASPAALSVAVGAPVRVKVTLKNMSKHPLDDSGNWSELTYLDPNFQFGAWDAQGLPVPKKKYWHPELAPGSQINRTLAPGESVTWDQEVSRVYDFSQPGKYTIQVAMEIPKEMGGPGKVKSNLVALTVTAKPVPPPQP
jgi:hypothetical protein